MTLDLWRHIGPNKNLWLIEQLCRKACLQTLHNLVWKQHHRPRVFLGLQNREMNCPTNFREWWNICFADNSACLFKEIRIQPLTIIFCQICNIHHEQYTILRNSLFYYPSEKWTISILLQVYKLVNIILYKKVIRVL